MKVLKYATLLLVLSVSVLYLSVLLGTPEKVEEKERIALPFGLFLDEIEQPVSQDKPIRRPVQSAKEELPEEGKVFVWQQPEESIQSMLILRVNADQSCEAAYLVPVRLKFAYSGKDNKEELEKLLVGHLAQVKLQGRDKAGTLQGDIWLNAKEGWLSKKK